MSNNTNSPASSIAPIERLAGTTSQFLQLSHSHQAPDVRRAEFIPGPTRPLNPFIEECLAMVPSFYKPNTVSQVRSIAKFFRFVARYQQIAERKNPDVQ
jgi:hypothetical protein